MSRVTQATARAALLSVRGPYRRYAALARARACGA